jgi:hypothetical protein
VLHETIVCREVKTPASASEKAAKKKPGKLTADQVAAASTLLDLSLTASAGQATEVQATQADVSEDVDEDGNLVIRSNVNTDDGAADFTSMFSAPKPSRASSTSTDLPVVRLTADHARSDVYSNFSRTMFSAVIATFGSMFPFGTASEVLGACSFRTVSVSVHTCITLS